MSRCEKLVEKFSKVEEADLSNAIAQAKHKFDALEDATGKLALKKEISKEYGALSKAMAGVSMALDKIDKKVK